MSVLATVISSNAALVANNVRIASVSVTAYEYALHFLRYSLTPENVLARYVLTLPAEYRFYRAFYRNNFRFKCQSCCFNVQNTQLIICIATASSCLFSSGQLSLLYEIVLV